MSGWNPRIIIPHAFLTGKPERREGARGRKYVVLRGRAVNDDSQSFPFTAIMFNRSLGDAVMDAELRHGDPVRVEGGLEVKYVDGRALIRVTADMVSPADFTAKPDTDGFQPLTHTDR